MSDALKSQSWEMVYSTVFCL